jgi:hypothetical protein
VRLLGISLLCCVGCASRAPSPPTDANAAATATAEPQPAPDPDPDPDPEVQPERTRSEPYEVCLEYSRSDLPCAVLVDHQPFEDRCEETAAAVEPGPTPELQVLRVACAYGEELRTEEHAVALIRESEGRFAVLWSGREIIQIERDSCVYAELTTFKPSNHAIVVETTTSVTRIDETALPCEARRSVTSERVSW